MLSEIPLFKTALLKPVQGLLRGLENMPAHQREGMMFWIGGLAPLATNAVTPLVTAYRFKHSSLPEIEKSHNVKQEVARQGISAALHTLSYFVLGKLLGFSAGRSAHKKLVEFLGGTAASFVAYAFVRPWVSSALILRWLYPNQKPSTGAAMPAERVSQGLPSASFSINQPSFTAALLPARPFLPVIPFSAIVAPTIPMGYPSVRYSAGSYGNSNTPLQRLWH